MLLKGVKTEELLEVVVLIRVRSVVSLVGHLVIHYILTHGGTFLLAMSHHDPRMRRFSKIPHRNVIICLLGPHRTLLTQLLGTTPVYTRG
jgi:hypothetical protein